MANFSDAIQALKDGKKVYRDGWNGKGMYVFLCTEPVEFNLDPFFVIKSVDGTHNTWFASMADTLAEDWSVLK